MFEPLLRRVESLYGHNLDQLRRARSLVLSALIVLIGAAAFLVISLLPLAFPAVGVFNLQVAILFALILPALLAGVLWLVFQRRLEAATWLLIGGFTVIGLLLILALGVSGSPALGVGPLIIIALSALVMRQYDIVRVGAIQIGVILLGAVLQVLGFSFAPPADLTEIAQAAGSLIGTTALGVAVLTLFFDEMSRTALAARQRADVLDSTLSVVESSQRGAALADDKTLLRDEAAAIQSAFGFDRVAIYVLPEGKDTAELLAQAAKEGLPVAGAPSGVMIGSSSIIGQALKYREAASARRNTGSEVALPILAGERLIGAIDIESTRVHSAAEIEAMQLMANHIGSALIIAEKFASESAILEETSLLFRSLRALAFATTPSQIIEVLRDHAARGFDRIALLSLSQGRSGQGSTGVLGAWDAADRDPTAPIPPEAMRFVGERIFLSEDVSQLADDLEPLRRYAEVTMRVESFGLFPLTGRTRIVGFLLLARRAPYRFSDEEIDIFQTLSHQVGAQVDAIMETTSLSRQVRRLSLITSIAQVAAGKLNEEDLGKQVADLMTRVMPLSHLSYSIYTSGADRARIINLHGSPAVANPVVNGSILERAYTVFESLYITSPAEIEGYGLWPGGSVGSVVLAPFRLGENTRGTLNVGAAAVGAFDREDLTLIDQAAAQVGPALQNILFFKSLQSSLDEANRLYATSLAMGAADDLSEVYNTAIAEITALSNPARLLIYIAGPDPRSDIEYLEEVLSWDEKGMNVHAQPDRYALADAPAMLRMLQSHQNILFEDVATDERLTPALQEEHTARGVSTIMLIPLITGSTWLGALIAEAGHPGAFSPAQMQRCRAIVDQMAAAVDAQLLLARARTAASRERILREIADRIRTAESPDTVLEIAAEEVSQVLGLPPSMLRDLTTYDTDRYELDQMDRELVDTIINQVALAIENLNLIESTQQAAFREHLVNEVTIELQRATTVDSVLETTVRVLQTILTGYDITLRLSPARLEASSQAASTS